MSVKIITDSAADLPRNIQDKLNIEVVPFFVYLDGQEFLDGETIQSLELLNGMRNERVYKTGQISPIKFKEKFSKYAQIEETVIYIALSSELSGTYQSAVLARNQLLDTYPDFELEVIDTKCASLGQGLVVYQAAQMAQEGKTKEDILKRIEFLCGHMEHIFTVDNLEYLARGGRISKSSAFIGGLLNIKPILDVEEGKLVPIEKVRGRKRVIKKILTIMEDRGIDLANQTIGISHGDDPEAVDKLIKMIENKFGVSNFIVNPIGSVIGAHAGPGTLAVFFQNKVLKKDGNI